MAKRFIDTDLFPASLMRDVFGLGLQPADRLYPWGKEPDEEGKYHNEHDHHACRNDEEHQDAEKDPNPLEQSLHDETLLFISVFP